MTDAIDLLKSPVSPHPEPQPLESRLSPVLTLDDAMMPTEIRDFVRDVSCRTQCPPDYVAICSVIVLAAVVGTKCSICPKQYDNWEVHANQWGAIIGPPSAMKSPALREAIKPLTELEKSGAEFAQEELDKQKTLDELSKLKVKKIKQQAQELYAENLEEDAIKLLDELKPRTLDIGQYRYIVNDASVEKLGELLNENPNGMLLVRDELSGWVAKLSQEDGQSERAFYLECFDGNSRFTYDRIGRGTIVIENCTLSLVGGIQPSKISRLIGMAMNGRADDGLVQRLQLSVFPDTNTRWEWRDQSPNAQAYDRYRESVRTLHSLDVKTMNSRTLRFTPDAQKLFADWMVEHRKDIDDADHHPVIQSHFAKTPKAIAGLALLFELVSGGRAHVGVEATSQALHWAAYLRSHALRLYGISTSNAIDSAKRVANRREKLPAAFTARDVRRKGWAGLTEQNDVRAALDCLVDHHHLIEVPKVTSSDGGRPTMQYRWNPVLDQKS